MPLPAEKPSRRKHHAADVPNGTGGGGRGFLSVRTVFCGVAVVFTICSFQLVLLFSHTDPAYESQSQNARLWHYLQVHEVNLTALALQQRELTRLMGQLNNLLVGQQKELHQVEDQLAQQPSPAQLPVANLPEGSADTAVLRKMKELKKQHQEELNRQYNEIAKLQAAVSRLSSDAPAVPVQTMPPEMPTEAPQSPPEDPGSEKSPSPPGSSAEWPEQWLHRFSASDLEASAKEAEQWRLMARNAAIHAWKGYRERAWGKDEMKPVSGAPGRVWGNTGLQILDALSTLWIMDLKEQFDEAADWVSQSLKFDHPAPVSFFEITIRALGGLLSAHALSGRPIFLQKARELGDKLLKAFNGQTGFPFTQLNLRTGEGKKGWYSGVVLAEAGTVQLEFRYLSQQSNDPKYAAAGDRAMRQILQAENGQGLVPWGLASSGPPRFTNSHITFGAMGDSYYEYLLKMYLQTDRSEPEWINAWRRAMDKMMSRLIFTSKGGLTYIAEEKNSRTDHKMDHLACFVGGMLIYGSRQINPEDVDSRWEQTAAGITETCYEMYHRQPSHLAPEASRFNPQGVRGQDMSVWNNAGQYLLRPEAAEAIFYMFYYTGDPKYRRWAGEIMEAIEKNCRTTHGYSAVTDVRRSPVTLRNEMETFFLAETLKYLYLTFVPNPRTVLNLDDFVITTEAHPLRIAKVGKANRQQRFLGK